MAMHIHINITDNAFSSLYVRGILDNRYATNDHLHRPHARDTIPLTSRPTQT